MYESAHVAITFQLLETILSQHPIKHFRIFTQRTYFKDFFLKKHRQFYRSAYRKN